MSEFAQQSNDFTNVDISLKEYRTKNSENLIIGSLNINSIRNKFDQLKLLVKDIIDILIIEETKLDETFPDGQFILEGFMPPIRKDRNRFGGGIMIFIRENIPAKVLENDLVTDIECVSVELNFQNNKWLLIGTYRPPSQCSKSYNSIQFNYLFQN